MPISEKELDLNKIAALPVWAWTANLSIPSLIGRSNIEPASALLAATDIVARRMTRSRSSDG